MDGKRTAFISADPGKCIACWKCIGICPGQVIGKVQFLGHKHIVIRNSGACAGCKKCVETCPQQVFSEVRGAKGGANKTLFYTDLVLIPLFVLTLYTGLELHVAGHAGNHEAWHGCAVSHVLSGLGFLIPALVHVKSHWGWYKGLGRGSGRKSRITAALSLFFAVEAVTGALLLCCVDGEGSFAGALHYGAGLGMGVLAIWHILKRFPILHKGLKRLWE